MATSKYLPQLHELAADDGPASSRPSLAARVREDFDPDFRSPFYRDYTRIIHSRAFRRLRHKTQVFVSPKNDHLCSRIEHTLHVASIAETIATQLGLNQALVRAIAAGHDVGHAPFGHEGERAITEAVHEITGDTSYEFHHELHSLRVIDRLESPYRDWCGLNLTFAVRDGIVSHYGEGFEPSLAPDRSKTTSDLSLTRRGKTPPATLEGCAVRRADKIAYLGRDLEDAVLLGLVRKDDVPPVVGKVLGETNREIIGTVIKDLVKHGIDNDCLKVSDDVHEALDVFSKFSKERIYDHDRVKQFFPRVHNGMKVLIEFLLNELEQGGRDPAYFEARPFVCIKLLGPFIRDDIRDSRDVDDITLAVDFVAGMTDSFFCEALQSLFVPEQTDFTGSER